MFERFLAPVGILAVVVALDQWTKLWGRSLQSLQYNSGFILGNFAELPDQIRVVAVCFFAGLLLLTYVLSLYLIPARGRWLRFSLSLLIGGILGNAIDRLSLGHTIDFIPLNFGAQAVVFNVADIFLWIGSAGVLWVLFRREEMVWFDRSDRKSYVVWPREQFRIAATFASLGLCGSIFIGIFAIAYLRILLLDLPHAPQDALRTFVLSYTGLSILFCGFTFLLGWIISHRMIGPVYAIKRYIEDSLDGSPRDLSLREADHYAEMAGVLKRLKEKLRD